jgi:hypothetical protein
MTLNALLLKEPPTQLRLLVSTAGPGSATYKSVGQFVEALKYFERPERREILSQIYRRAVETPTPTVASADTSSASEKSQEKRPMSARRRWAVAAIAVLAVGAGAVAVAEKSDPGMVTGHAASVQATAANWWATAMEATAEFRAAASEDFSTVVDRMDEIRTDITEDMGIGDADADTSEDAAVVGASESMVGGGTERVRPDPSPAADTAPAAELESDNADADVVVPDVLSAEGPGPVAASEETTVRVSSRPLVSSAIFDSGDSHVMPPTIVRLQLPTVADDSPWSERVSIVEAIVSASGQVEKVKLLSPYRGIHQAMILSAVKTWRFRPALKDGDAVRYRHLIPIAVPGCQTRACS